MVTSKLHRFRINKLRLFVSGAATVKVELFKKIKILIASKRVVL